MVNLIIVDDERATRDGLVQYIPWGSLGVSHVESAGSGAEALQVAKELKPDILVSDIKMPGMNGIEFATRLKELLPDCKIIFLSGYADKEYLKSAIQLRAVHYLEKPINREEFKRIIRETALTVSQERTIREEQDVILKERIVLDMIGGRLTNADPVQPYKHLLRNLTSSCSFVTAMIQIDLYPDQAEESVHQHRSAIRQAVDLVFKSPLYHHLAGFKDDRHLVVLLYGKGITNHILSPMLVTLLKEKIEEFARVKADLFMGIGKLAESVSHVKDSYQTAELALQKRFFAGANQMAVYDDKTSNENGFRLDRGVTSPFIARLNEGDKEHLLRFIHELHDEIRRHPDLPVESVKDFFYGMLLELNAFAAAYNIDPAEAHARAYDWDVFSKLSSLTEIRDYMQARIDYVMNNIQAKHLGGQHVFTIMHYIQEHYHDEHLSISKLAQHTFLTPNYLCRIFKEKTGKTINQYLTEIRMEKAKEHLREGRVKLSDISIRVGYQSANHFAKIFKKMTGMNPSEFRERQ
ncbi:response regulator [Paenibacillus methanolicus]|uniref:Two-component system response regulator YesN n=1 Tax=Paenibacillus methanolicus TaxID=582686 RepID=A0A5S5CD59_9BACL|nr:response regulator [Paenibacillus methanolicus]TYP76578.1 two-component system response regulator YesN [Paenibacillus methanolicus]